MYELQIHTLRSRSLSGSELSYAIGQFAASSSKEDFETYITPEAYACPLVLHELPTLDAFRSVSSTFGVTLNTKSRRPDAGDIFCSFTRRTHDLSLNHVWTSWYVGESRPSLEGSGKCDLSISAGLRKEGCFCGIYVHRPSPAADDILRRAAFFQRVIAELDLDRIRISVDSDVLRMEAFEPWKLAYPSARLDGSNPSGFYACGFAEIGEALSAGQRLVQRFAKTTFGVGFVAKLTGKGYRSVFRELNAAWHLWDINVMGSLTPEAISILQGGEISSTSPSRIPAFTWYRERTSTAYGSVVIENGERYLEIATDGGTLELLQERVAFLEDVEFYTAFP